MNDSNTLMTELERIARFEEGVPADPTQNMSPEDAKKWKEMNDLHGDKFKTAADKEHRYQFTVLGKGDEPSYTAEDKLQKAVAKLGWDKLEIHDESSKYGSVDTAHFALSKLAIGDIPADVERYVKEVKESNPDYDDAKAWATAWSIYCKYKNPGAESCTMPTSQYFTAEDHAANRLAALYYEGKKAGDENTKGDSGPNKLDPIATWNEGEIDKFDDPRDEEGEGSMMPGMEYRLANDEFAELEFMAEGCPDNLDESECKEWEANTDRYKDKFKEATWNEGDVDYADPRDEEGEGSMIPGLEDRRASDAIAELEMLAEGCPDNLDESECKAWEANTEKYKDVVKDKHKEAGYSHKVEHAYFSFVGNKPFNRDTINDLMGFDFPFKDDEGIPHDDGFIRVVSPEYSPPLTRGQEMQGLQRETVVHLELPEGALQEATPGILAVGRRAGLKVTLLPRFRKPETQQGPAPKQPSRKPFPFRASEEDNDAKEGKFEKGKPADPTENMSPEDAADWKKQNKEHADQFKTALETQWDEINGVKVAAVAPTGLYGFTRSIQSCCEGSISKLTRMASKIAKAAYKKDENVAPFLAAHAKRSNSLPAKILVEAMKSIGPRIASTMRLAELRVAADVGKPIDKVAARKYGLYGYSTKTASLGLHACSSVRENAGTMTSDLHSRKADAHNLITGFLKEHSKQAGCVYAKMLHSSYPDAERKTASVGPKTVEDWIIWED